MAALDLPAFLFQLAAIVALAGAFRWIAARVRQPPVLGEITLGILVGPSFLQWAWPAAHDALFPAQNRELLEATAWIGLVLFMYIAGSEMRWNWRDRNAILFAGLGGLAVPFTLGLALSLLRPEWFFPGDWTLRHLVLVSLVMTVSALPVLARLLSDVKLLDHPIGTITLGAGTLDDVVAWTLLALVAGSADVGLSGDFLLNLGLLVALVLFAILLDHFLHPWLRRAHLRPAGLFVWLLIAILSAALLTHTAGLHAVLGPLAVGAILSRHPPLRDYARTRLGDLTLALFLPVFFVLAGSQADLQLLAGTGGLTALLVVLLAASLGKVLGVYLGARAANVTPQASLVSGILLNARGAVGLVVAKVGFDGGLLSGQGFAILVAVIALTTLAAPPALEAYLHRLEAHAEGKKKGQRKVREKSLP